MESRAEKQRRFAKSHLRKLVGRFRDSNGGLEEGRDLVEWLAIVALSNPEVIRGPGPFAPPSDELALKIEERASLARNLGDAEVEQFWNGVGANLAGVRVGGA